MSNNEEYLRIKAHYEFTKDWLKWGPYLSERQWGTVREDYSYNGDAWAYVPFEHAKSKSYRWGEDGIGGISDRNGRLCFCPVFWNGKDEILKERLFGLSGTQGNHGEDVKELYYYLNNCPSHSYMRYLYKYPIKTFPYEDIRNTSVHRSRNDEEYEILDTDVFDKQEYFDIEIEYAKADVDDIYIRVTIHNRAAHPAKIDLLGQLWFRNDWIAKPEKLKPTIYHKKSELGYEICEAFHSELGSYYFYYSPHRDHLLFTENESNTELLEQRKNKHEFVKDAFHDTIINHAFDWISAKDTGTKCAIHFAQIINNSQKAVFKFRLSDHLDVPHFDDSFNELFLRRRKESNQYLTSIYPAFKNHYFSGIIQQANAGMLWSKQFYNYDIKKWLNGDPLQSKPPITRKKGRNVSWEHLSNEDIISMPDKWEYPWYAAWDLAFHCLPLARIDFEFAKGQLLLILKENYLHPNGQIPAYEWSFGDVNPPVHAWAAIRVFQIGLEKTGKKDIPFLKAIFHKLLLNFTWWVNQKDRNGNNIFEGGFLGLDNIGAFDRSKELPENGILEQADGTAWMAMYCLNMMEIGIELALEDPVYEDLAIKFLQHFTQVAKSLNKISHHWPNIWDEEEGFFYDVLTFENGLRIPMKIRSIVGLVSLFGNFCLYRTQVHALKKFEIKLNEYIGQQRKGSRCIFTENKHAILFSLIPELRLQRVLKALLDKDEFLSDFGIRSMSKLHEIPFVVSIKDTFYAVKYEPGESENVMFGGNSNWRGPIWFPINYLIIESLQNYYHYYGNEFQVKFPGDEGDWMNLEQVASELAFRLLKLFLPTKYGHKPIHGEYHIYAKNEHFKNLYLFYEYFHGENGKGLGAAHQTGWTGLILELIHRYEDFLTDRINGK